MKSIKNIRLLSQQLVSPQFNDVKELVDWFGMMQAQDFSMVQWAVLMRLKNKSLKKYIQAYNSAQILRTHLFRCTWQLVTAEDYKWMLPLCYNKNINAINGYMSYHGNGTEYKDYLINRKFIATLLNEHSSLTKSELLEACRKNGFNNNEHVFSCYIRLAEQEGLIINGDFDMKQNTYSLVEKRLKDIKNVSYEESLKLLARKYFQSHSPATLEDFVWWTNLPKNTCRNAMESIKHELTEEKYRDMIFYIHNNCRITGCRKATLLMPAYDEYLIGYKSRHIVIEDRFKHKAYNNTGIFRPIIVQNGNVVGTWSRTKGKTEFFMSEYQSDTEQLYANYRKIFKQ